MTFFPNRRYIAIAVSLLWLAGCSTHPTSSSDELDPARSCQQQLKALQQAVQQHGTADAQYAPVAGFPTYRSNRFWSSFAEQPLSSDQQRFWRQQLHNLGMASLALEWNNLPPATQTTLPPFRQFNKQCNTVLFDNSMGYPLPPSALAVPDSYSTWQRFFGFYGLIKYGAAGSIADYQQDMRQRIEGFSASDDPHQTLTFIPPAAKANTTPAPVTNWLQVAYTDNPLALPQLTPDQIDALLARHAPVITVQQQSPADLPGAAQWVQQKRQIDSSQPTLYSDTGYLRYGDRILLQLSYTLWFSERPKPTANDWYGGPLDGLVWRVTLQENGEVLFYDSIHPCGCYHSVHIPADSPLQARLPAMRATDALEPILAFSTTLKGNEYPANLVVEAATHYLVQVGKQAANSGTPYQIKDYDQLRSLPTDDGFRSWFDEDGLIASSARRERYFLWPLGVPNAGAMRQQGHHAIAFVGRRHFDEASVERLLDLAP